MKLTFASANAGKLQEVRRICELLENRYGICPEVSALDQKVDIPETGSTYRENALIKAQWVMDHYGESCFSDDSGLEVEALGGAPGIYTARYCDRNFSSGMDKLLFELKSLGAMAPERRRASFECCICLFPKGGVPVYFEGHCPGIISLERRGDGGFGFDPVFIPDASPKNQCMAQLDEDFKNKISHRALAMEQMISYLKNNPI